MTDAPIARVRFTHAGIALRVPLRTAAGTLTSRRSWLVRIEDRDGVEGFGEATPLDERRSEDADRVGADLRASLPGLVGRPSAVGANAARIDGARTPSARFALESALLDLRARAEGRPVAALLAGPPAGPPARCMPVQWLVGEVDARAAASSAADAVRSGFETIKVKVGGDPGADLDRLAAVREAIGPTRILRADANGAWTFEQAAIWLRSAREVGLSLLEQPTPHLEDLARLRGLGVEIGLDEGLAAPGDAARAIGIGAADVWVLKPGPLGGLRACHGLAARAREAGVRVIVGGSLDGAFARAAALHLAASLPDHHGAAGLGTGALLASDLGSGPEVVGGALAVDGPGLGVVPAPDLAWETP